MSKTPQTDAAVVSREFIVREMDVYAHKFVLADIAREIEQERDALRAALKGLSDMYGHAWDLIDGGLFMNESSTARFEKAHKAAFKLLEPK